MKMKPETKPEGEVSSSALCSGRVMGHMEQLQREGKGEGGGGAPREPCPGWMREQKERGKRRLTATAAETTLRCP